MLRPDRIRAKFGVDEPMRIRNTRARDDGNAR
jgi:hypothetical protein